jgi:hypothetical protein
MALKKGIDVKSPPPKTAEGFFLPSAAPEKLDCFPPI